MRALTLALVLVPARSQALTGMNVKGTLEYGGKCLDLPGGDTTNGNRVWMWECNGSENQMWTYDTCGKYGYGFEEPPYRLRYSADPSKCIDLPGNNPTDGAQLWIWDCLDVDDEINGQSFNVEQFFTGPHNGHCGEAPPWDSCFIQKQYLAVSGEMSSQMRYVPGAPDDGSGVFLWTCNSGDSDWCADDGFVFNNDPSEDHRCVFVEQEAQV